MKSRHCFISQEVVLSSGTDLLLDLSPFEPAIEVPVFSSIYDYLSFSLDEYEKRAVYDGEAEFDEHGNLVNDIDDSFEESQDIFDDFDNYVNSVLNSFNDSSSTEQPNEEVSEPHASEPTSAGGEEENSL